MAVYDMKELIKLGKTAVTCPICIKGTVWKGWYNRYKPIQTRLRTDAKIGEDLNGPILGTVLVRVIECEKHGVVEVEEEL